MAFETLLSKFEIGAAITNYLSLIAYVAKEDDTRYIVDNSGDVYKGNEYRVLLQYISTLPDAHIKRLIKKFEKNEKVDMDTICNFLDINIVELDIANPL